MTESHAHIYPLDRVAVSELGEQTFEAIVFDWDGTAVPDRRADATAVRIRVEALCAAGVDIFVVSGTHVGNVDGQLRARPSGPGRLYLCLNRGSEVFEVTTSGPSRLWSRVATNAEERGLDDAAALTVERLRTRGIAARVVSERLNRRKIDIIDEAEWAEPPKAVIGELLTAVSQRLRTAGIDGIAEVVGIATEAAHEAGLADPRITSDVKHVEIGLTDKSDSARWAAATLADRGITGALVLVGGDEFGPLDGVPGSDSLMLVPELARAAVVSVGVEPGGLPAGIVHASGGPAAFLGVLDNQLERRAARRVPTIDDDPAWIVPLPTAAVRQGVAEALGALSNGRVGIRGDGPAGRRPLFAVSGMYTATADQRLLPGPLWSGLLVRGAGHASERVLDLRTGVLAWSTAGIGLRALRLVSIADPHALALRVEGLASRLQGGELLARPDGTTAFERHDHDGVALARTSAGSLGITVAASEWEQTRGGRRAVERLATWTAGDSPRWAKTATSLKTLESTGFDAVLAAHRAAWAHRWRDADVTIEGSADDQLAARFAVFQLLSATPESGEASVGARGLTGDAYGGHVFWDADVFVLPAVAALHPDGARAMLEYRIRRLPAARAAAAAAGLRGARFPWESAADGSDVTPSRVRGSSGELIPIRTGGHEVHIVADVAWAAAEYARWTGDSDFLNGPGRGLLVETARYWASRARFDRDGRAHLYGVMGPDEYHEVVDDNAYTNVMARWNLRRAADLVTVRGGDPAEVAEATSWRGLASVLVDGLDDERALYEQFAGYFDLEPLLIADIATPPIAADMLLGADRVASSQLIKQADVVMLHHLVPDEVAPGSLAANLAYYAPRTAHGSSLSPAIHAALLARAGRPDDALELFRVASRLDLDDLTGTTAGGLHLAALGGVWQALAYGFLGLRPSETTLTIDPSLPGAWHALSLRFGFRGSPVGVRADRETLRVDCESPLMVRVAAGPPCVCEPPGQTYNVRRTMR